MSETAASGPIRPTIWQPRQPVFWLFSALLLLGTVFTVLQTVKISSSLAGLAAAIVLVGVQGAVLFAVVRAMPRFRRQPLSLSLAALLWGATFAAIAAGVFNAYDGAALHLHGIDSVADSIRAPLNEDLLRFIGVLMVLVFAYGRRITVMDGAVYGFLVGSGFELIENFDYALMSENFAATVSTGSVRLILGFGLHALWTTVAGAALAYCLSRVQRGAGGRWWVLAPALLIPALLHAGWDSPPFSVLPPAKLLLFIVLYTLTLVMFFFVTAQGRRSEYAWYVDVTGTDVSRKAFARLPRRERRALAAAAVSAEHQRETAVADPEHERERESAPPSASVSG